MKRTARDHVRCVDLALQEPGFGLGGLGGEGGGRGGEGRRWRGEGRGEGRGERGGEGKVCGLHCVDKWMSFLFFGFVAIWVTDLFGLNTF